MTKFDIPKPEPAGKRVGLIFDDLRVFYEARTRLITGLEKCQSAEAYEVFEAAVDALGKINGNFYRERERV
tara:strand:+ start:183 stop:395 length:213 start_codon:yes stop_codon:yes gene_type:complete